MLVGRTCPRLYAVPCHCCAVRTYAKSLASAKGKTKRKTSGGRIWGKKADEKFRHLMDSMVGSLREEVEKGGHMDKFFCCHSFTKAVEENHAACLAHLLSKTNNPEGYTALHVAASLKAGEMIHQLISAGIDPNQPSNTGSYPLLLAASKCSGLVVAHLLQGGADPQVTDREGHGVIYWSVSGEVENEDDVGNANVFGFFLEKMTHEERESAIFYKGRTVGRSAILAAAENGHWQFLKLVADMGFSRRAVTCSFLLSLDPDMVSDMLRERDKDGRLPLHYLSGKGELGLFCEVLDKCLPYIDMQDDTGNTPLHLATGLGNLNAALVLAKAGASLDIPNVDGMKPIHFAAKFMVRPEGDPDPRELKHPGRRTLQEILERDVSTEEYPNISAIPDILRLLVENSNVNARTDGGETALHSATEEGFIHNVAYLLKNGADPNLVDSNANTPLHLAAYHGWITILLLLIENGAKVNEYNVADQTPLHVAIGQEHWGALYYLLVHGADYEAPTADGIRPIHAVATLAGKNAGPILKAFVKRGANLNHQTAAGMTALDLALEYNNKEGAEILLRAGARTNFYKNKHSE